ncbi:hypothetical protein FACS1894211_06210 [Clostridia bacterium]|nr:hypothetical protein FACS1894211_06210 [Clostridia bacterium]
MHLDNADILYYNQIMNKYCAKCGQELEGEAKFCTRCGTACSAVLPSRNDGNGYAPNGAPFPPVYGAPYAPPPPSPYYAPPQPVKRDGGSFGYALLGFLWPLIGLILFCVWKDDLPLRAKSCGKGALLSVILTAVFIVLAIIVNIFRVRYHIYY